MSKGTEGKKESFKQIFRDGWEEFKVRHPRYEAMDEVVQKMLGCGEFANGYAVYICPDCFAEKKVPFSCKSGFCLSCAKTYTANWVETIQGMLHGGRVSPFSVDGARGVTWLVLSVFSRVV